MGKQEVALLVDLWSRDPQHKVSKSHSLRCCPCFVASHSQQNAFAHLFCAFTVRKQKCSSGSGIFSKNEHNVFLQVF